MRSPQFPRSSALLARSPSKTVGFGVRPAPRAWIGALGAAASALVGYTALATINAMLTTEGGAWFSVYLIFAVVASLISGAAAAALIWWTEIRARAAEAPNVRANGAAEPAH